MYNFLTSDVSDNILIYHFRHHGSRKLSDLAQLNNNPTLQKACFMIMHDQEPLMPSFYNYQYLKEHAQDWYQKNFGNRTSAVLDFPEWQEKVYNSNLAFVRFGLTDYDRNILVHSELRSQELEFYQNLGFETVYWWSHAMISLDWYRYAQYDPLLLSPRNPKFAFNIYSRAWHYPREYRLKLLDLVVESNLQSHCQIKFNTHDQDIHYTQYQYHNHTMQAHNCLDCFTDVASGSAASASYSAQDYQDSWFDVVLETLFDDSRLHLTEKTLRPIACGVPFLLCGTQGSLEYLRSYGFRTFGDIIDESYDDIADPQQRLKAIAHVMKDICQRNLMHNQHSIELVKEICEHNQRRFFSSEFAELIINEFQCNFDQARQQCNNNCTGHNRSQLLTLLNQRSTAPSQSGDNSC